jgi:hypothetical protein
MMRITHLFFFAIEGGRLSRSRIAVAVSVVALVATACSSGKPGGSSPASTTVHLVHMPAGTAAISLDKAKSSMTVAVSVRGLAPGSTHVEGIGKGSCTKGNGLLYPLEPLVADSHGVASATSTVGGVSAVPSPAFVHVHTGPAMATKGRGLACADLSGPGTVTLGPDSTEGGSGNDVTGTAKLTEDTKAKTLRVTVSVDGLEPNTSHPNHIHLGSCESQGPVAFALTDLKADASGHAEATTTLPKVSSIDYGAWYVNVHQGPGLATQQQFAPVACGDVTR